MTRRASWWMAALLSGSALGAQVPAPTTPAPAQPAARMPGPRRSEFRVGGFMLNGERSYDFTDGGSTLDGVNSNTGTIRGVEVLLRAPAIGLYFRSLSGTFTDQPQVISADARLLLFPPVFTIFGGVGKRALSTELATPVYDVIVGGVSSTVNIGGTGLRTHISGAVLVAKGQPTATGGESPKGSGLEGEAAIYYRIPAVPLYVMVGYRTEVFSTKTGTLETPEEVRGIRVGGGIQFGGR